MCVCMFPWLPCCHCCTAPFCAATLVCIGPHWQVPVDVACTFFSISNVDTADMAFEADIWIRESWRTIHPYNAAPHPCNVDLFTTEEGDV